MSSYKTLDVVGLIMEYEDGGLSARDTLKLFSHLIMTGMAWSLQGSYGRAAMSFIENGYISPKGQVLKSIED